MKTKQEFLDSVAKDCYLDLRSQLNCAPRQECAVAAYHEAETLWEERERRRKESQEYQDELEEAKEEIRSLRIQLRGNQSPMI